MVQFVVMEDNIVRSEDVAPKPAKKATKKAASPSPKPTKAPSERNNLETVAKAPDGYKFVLFDSGYSYITPSGYRFTQDNRIHLLPDDEADHLLTFDNFRLPDQNELLEYAETIED